MRLRLVQASNNGNTNANASSKTRVSSGPNSSTQLQPNSSATQANNNTHQPYGPERYGELEDLLGYTFVDRSWLERALTHRSVQTNGVKSDYERLEFLGDAVFDLAVAHILLDTHQSAHEGELSKMRAALVNTASLAETARKLGIGNFIRLSRGELASGAHDRPSILADVMEAVIGAIYREAGFPIASTCVARLLGDKVTTVTPRDPKTELQEALHAIGSEPPVYRLEMVEGPEHSPTFVSIVEVGGEIVGRGRGSTKKASQQAAAEEALSALAPQSTQPEGFALNPSGDEGDSDSEEETPPASSTTEEITDSEINHE
jgi:ribonuclease-3